MVQFTFEKATYFGTLLQAVSALVADATLTFTQNGLAIRAFDPSHVALVDFELTAFDTYVLDVPSARFGVNLPNLLKVLKRAKEKEKLEFTFDVMTNKITVKFKGGVKVRTFVIPTQQPDPNIPDKVPNMALSTTVKVAPAELLDMLQDTEVTSDNVVLTVDKGLRVEQAQSKPYTTFQLFGRGDLSQAIVDLEANVEGSTVSVETESEGIVQAVYNLSYLTGILSNAKDVAEGVVLTFGNNLPVKLSFGISNGFLTYFLASRIEKTVEVSA